MKYQKLHRLEKELLPGERFHLEREMERNVKVITAITARTGGDRPRCRDRYLKPFSGLQEPSQGVEPGETGAGPTEETEKQRDQK